MLLEKLPFSSAEETTPVVPQYNSNDSTADILRAHYGTLYQSITESEAIRVACLLHAEYVISRGALMEIVGLPSYCTHKLLKTLRSDSKHLIKFADAVRKYVSSKKIHPFLSECDASMFIFCICFLLIDFLGVTCNMKHEVSSGSAMSLNSEGYINIILVSIVSTVIRCS